MKRKPPKPQMQWYIIKVRAGKAKSVKREIDRQKKVQMLDDYIGKVIIPRKRQLVLKKSVKGERRVEENKMRFGRGYLFVHAALKTQTVWRVLNSTMDSLGLMPEKYNPTPVDEETIKQLLDEQKADRRENVKVKTGLKVGDTVEALEGMFQGMDGQVTAVEGDGTNDPRIGVVFKILGRPVVADFKHYQVSYMKGK